MKKVPALTAALFTPIMLAQAPVVQVTSSNDTGVARVSALSVKDGVVNLTNGNLSLSIPLLTLPGRGDTAFTLALQYDSKVWQPHVDISGVGNTDATVSWRYQQWGAPVGNLGWHLNLPYLSPGQALTDSSGALWGFGEEVLTLPDGSSISIPAYTSGMDSEDGSAALMTYTASSPFYNPGPSDITITVGNGLKFHFPSFGSVADKITDRNGNYLTINNNVVTDSAGHQVTLHTQTSPGFNSFYNEIDYYDNTDAQPQQIMLNTALYTLFNSTNTSSPQYTGSVPFTYPIPASNVCYTSCYGHIWRNEPNLNAAYTMLTSLVFPNGNTYQFDYNGFGEITKVSYPGGGYATYDYRALAHGETYFYDGELLGTDFREVYHEYLCPKAASPCASSELIETTYDGQVTPGMDPDPNGATSNTQATVTVQQNSAMLAKTFYTYILPQPDAGQYERPLEASRVSYDVDGTTPVSATTTSYFFYNDGFAVPQAVTNFTCTSASSALSSTTTLAYQTTTLNVMRPLGLAYSARTPQTDSVVLTPNILTRNSYDFVSRSNCGTGAPAADSYGTLLRQDTATYSASTAQYAQANLYSLPLTESVYGGINDLAAQTTYEYDVYSGTNHAALGASGAINHDAVSGSIKRGNRTAISRWVSGTDWITTYDQYYDTGSLSVALDGRLNATTYGYDSNFLFPTSVTNAKSQSETYTYFPATGELHLHADANGNTTTYAYDNMLRLTDVTLPPDSNGQSGGAHLEYTNANLAKQFTKQSQSVSVERDYIYDGLGRTVETQLVSDPEGAVLVDTVFDGMGRISTTSNPYRVADASHGTSRNFYDGLGRRTEVLNQDSSIQTFSYTSNTMTSTDEVGNTHQNTSDALGRLVKVVEPGGLNTTYSYDTLGNLKCADQWGTATVSSSCSGARSRSFTYDSLSRLITAQNPETGTICYGTWNNGSCVNGYDANSNLLHKTDARDVTINYVYDDVNRLTAKTYTGETQNTPNSCFQYDDTGVTNGVGRLSAEWTQFGSCPAAKPPSGYLTMQTVQAYDGMGRASNESQNLSLNGGGSQSFPLNWSYDLSGALVGGTNGLPATDTHSRSFSYGYDAVGRLSTVSSTPIYAPPHSSPVAELLFDASAAGSYSPVGLVNAKLSTSEFTGRPAMTLSKTYDATRMWTTSETYLGPTRSIGGTPSAGSIAISGIENGGASTPAAPGSVSISLDGVIGTHPVCTFTYCGDEPNVGTLTIFVNDFSVSVDFDETSTESALADALAAGFGTPDSPVSGSPVTALTDELSLTLTSIATGVASNYPYAVINTDWTSGFPVHWCGVGCTDPVTTLAGGQDAQSVFDSGTITVSIDGTSLTPVAWGIGDNSTGLASTIAGLIHTAQPSWSVVPIGGTITLQSSAGSNARLAVSVNDTAGLTPSFSASASDLSGGTAPSSSTNIVYSYAVTSRDVTGNILAYNDSVNGNWNSITYDSLNRLTGANVGSIGGSSQAFCWVYDAFGNRTWQATASANPGQPCNNWSGASEIKYDAKNRITGTSFFPVVDSSAYDAGGDLGIDLMPNPSGTYSQYSYDAEGRICASQAGSNRTQYIYDAEGHRVAKGTVNAVYIYDPQTQTNKLSCNVASNGFSETYAYALGHTGEQMTEIKNGQWQHTNLDIAGGLLATRDVKGLHYQISDWLGNRRVQTDPNGVIEETCTNQPFGDNLQCVTPAGAPVTADDATEHHFSGKERDAESGLDYFGARYHASSMGRFMSPDWSPAVTPIPYATLDNPQSVNLYSFVGNNPLYRRDPDGHRQVCAPDTSRTEKDGSVTVFAGKCHEERDGFWGGVGAVLLALNPWGKLGGPAHRASVNKIAEILQQKGFEVQKEVRIEIPNGYKTTRYVDVVGYKRSTGETEMYQVGGSNKDGTPVSREVKALDDIEQATGLRPQFVDKGFADKVEAITLRSPVRSISESPEGPLEDEPIEPMEFP